MKEGTDGVIYLCDDSAVSVELFCGLSALLFTTKQSGLGRSLFSVRTLSCCEIRSFICFADKYDVDRDIVRAVCARAKTWDSYLLVEEAIPGFEWSPKTIAMMARSVFLGDNMDALSDSTCRSILRHIATADRITTPIAMRRLSESDDDSSSLSVDE